MKPAITLAILTVALAPCCYHLRGAPPDRPRIGSVRVDGHSLTDDGGPFLGLGVSYFTALWRCKHDRERLESDLAFLAGQGINYFRMLTMVGHFPSWDDREIAPVAITSNHNGPGEGEAGAFDRVYANSAADIATWHFSRDRRTDAGWKPVHDCWDFADRPGCPPVSSNEPIGPGSSVNTEAEPLRLVMAAAFGYAAKLPMFVFHCEAGVFGKQRFEETPAVDCFTEILRLLPADLPNWQRNDGKEANAPFTLLAPDGCVRMTGSRKADRFVGVPIGIRAGGFELQARHALQFTSHDPLTGHEVQSVTLRSGEKVMLSPGPGALIILGRALPVF